MITFSRSIRRPRDRFWVFLYFLLLILIFFYQQKLNWRLVLNRFFTSDPFRIFARIDVTNAKLMQQLISSVYFFFCIIATPISRIKLWQEQQSSGHSAGISKHLDFGLKLSAPSTYCNCRDKNMSKNVNGKQIKEKKSSKTYLRSHSFAEVNLRFLR